MKTILALCSIALMAGCSSVPVQPAQKVESNQACDYALMHRIDSVWEPAVTQRYWVHCPQVQRTSNNSSSAATGGKS
jgi:hypothetical protein